MSDRSTEEDDVLADKLAIPRREPDESEFTWSNRIAARLAIDGFEIEPSAADLEAFEDRAIAAILAEREARRTRVRDVIASIGDADDAPPAIAPAPIAPAYHLPSPIGDPS